MSNIKVVEKHTLGAAEAKNRVIAFSSFLEEKGVKAIWNGNRAEVKGPFGVGGDINVTDTQVEVNVKLPMMARAVIKADKLEGSIRRRLVEKLNG